MRSSSGQSPEADGQTAVAASQPRPGDAAALVAKRVLKALDVLVPRMGRAYCDEIPEYAALPSDFLKREVLNISRALVEDFFSHVDAGLDSELLDVRASIRGAGRKRLEMGVPLESSLHAFRIAGRVVWEAVVEAVGPGEEGALAPLGAAWIDFIDRASTTFAEGYLEASQDHLRRLDARRRALVDALLGAQDGADAAAVAAEYSLNLADRYQPVLADGPDVTTRIDAMLAVAAPETLAGFRSERILLLVPGEVTPAMLRALESAGPLLLTWGYPGGVGNGLAEEVRAADALLDAARAVGLERGVFGPEDLLVEQLMHEHGRVGDVLRRTILAPLIEGDPDGIFRSTLRRYLRSGSVPDTAEDEVVHPNTAAYRLKRVREITGLDPRVPEDAALLVLAMQLDRLVESAR